MLCSTIRSHARGLDLLIRPQANASLNATSLRDFRAIIVLIQNFGYLTIVSTSYSIQVSD